MENWVVLGGFSPRMSRIIEDRFDIPTQKAEIMGTAVGTPAPSTIDQISTETMRYAPTALATIIAVEKAIKEAAGATKADIVIQSTLAAAQALGQSSDVTLQSIGALTSLLVGVLNTTGLFQHGGQAA